MAYQVEWVPWQAEDCRRAAESRSMPLGQENALGYLYRFVDCDYASRGLSDCEDDWYTTTKVELIAYPILSRTPCGHWIQPAAVGSRRFVNLSWNKQFALPTLELAQQSYVARKTRQARIYRARAQRAERCIWLLKGAAYAPL